MALRGGVEHNRLRRPDINNQIIIETCGDGKQRLVYNEDALQKTNQGGLMAKNMTKRVFVYEGSDRSRCPVRLYKKYINLLPQTRACGKLYLRPRVKCLPSVWYCDQPLGKNKVGLTVRSICNIAGIEGNFTNHSLRASAASRIYEKEIPEQMIKEVTGHRSDCVRVYKHTPEDLKQKASASIGGSKDTVKPSTSTTHNSEPLDLSQKQVKRLSENLSVCQMMRNVIKTRMELRKKKKIGIGRVRSLAKSVVKRRLGVIKRNAIAPQKKLVIDVNVNLNVDK